MKIYTVTLVDCDGNRDPEAATNVVGAFTNEDDAFELFHKLLDEAMEGRDCTFTHSEDEHGTHWYRSDDEDGLTLDFTVFGRFAMDDEGLWTCKIEETDLEGPVGRALNMIEEASRYSK